MGVALETVGGRKWKGFEESVSEKLMCFELTNCFFFFLAYHVAYKNLVPQPGIEPWPWQWKCHVLTIVPSGNSFEQMVNRSLMDSEEDADKGFHETQEMLLEIERKGILVT